MSPAPKEPFRESNLDSAEYRERLMRKLNCLIAVLEVANAKVAKSLGGPAPDVDRLEKIRGNLTSTLVVCRRARLALERRENLPDDLPENLAQIVLRRNTRVPKRNRLPLGAHIEMSSPAERARFERLGKISPAEVESCDYDELSRRLFG